MKTVTLYRPMSIEGAIKDFDRYMETFFSGNLLAPAAKNLHLPVMDIAEHEDAYSVEMELPGFDEKNIEVHINGKEITVASKQEETTKNDTEENTEAKAEKAEAKERFILRERKTISFSRTFSLPENADYESISAKFKNGILSLEVKKLPETKKRTIQIETN